MQTSGLIKTNKNKSANTISARMVRARVEERLSLIVSRIAGASRAHSPCPGFGAVYLAFEAIIPFDVLYRTGNTFSEGAYFTGCYKTIDDFIEIADVLFDHLAIGDALAESKQHHA